MTENSGVDGKLPPAVQSYVAAVVTACGAGPVLSVILFGSSVTGGYQDGISDVDLLLVVRDDAEDADRQRTRDCVAELEMRHGVAKRESLRQDTLAGALKRFADRITANQRTFFICTRADLLSGEPRRILGLPSSQAAFVDRVAIPSIVSSGITIWGEPLLDLVPLPAIRRLDVAKAFFGLFNTVLLAAATFAVLPEATKYAMDALKRSVHNCYFIHHRRSAPLAMEVAYFESRYGVRAALAQLLSLRRDYRPSLLFIVRCFPTLLTLHRRTAADLSFPREARVLGRRQPPNGDAS